MAGAGKDWRAQWPNPYVGPRPYTRSEAAKLGGRNAEIRRLLNLLIANRILLLHAPSGAGKTSLVQAGLVPKLEDEEDFWVSPPLRVNRELETSGRAGSANRYIVSLLLSLEEAKGEEEQLDEEKLAGQDLANYLAEYLPSTAADRDQVFIFDQFEEILTIEPFDETGKMEFFRQVGEALRNRGRWALFIIRDDFVARLEPYRLTIPTQFKKTFALDLLRAHEAGQAVRRPVEQARFAAGNGQQSLSVRYKTEAVETLVDKLRQGTPYVEPVILQVVCLRLWADLARDKRLEDGLIDVIDLEEMVDVNQALSAYYAGRAARAAQRTGMSERQVRDWVEDNLINQQGVRTLVLLDNESRPLANELIASHLVRVEERRGSAWAELAHDRLVDPVFGDNEAWRKNSLSVMQLQAELWAERGKPDELLFTGEMLREAQEWVGENEGELSETDQNFLDKSRAAQKRLDDERRRNRLFLGAIGIFGIVAIGLAVIAFILYGRSQATQEQLMLSLNRIRASQLAEWSREELAQDQELALLLATTGLGTSVQSDTRARFYRALFAPFRHSLEGHKGIVWSASFSPNGQLIVTASDDGRAKVWDLDGHEVASLAGHEGWVNSASFSPDGLRIVTASDDGSAKVWDLDGNELVSLEGHGCDEFGFCRIYSASFSPDGTPGGERIVTASSDGSAKLWDLDGHEVASLEGHDGAVLSANFTPDGAPGGVRIVTAGLDGRAKLWDLDGNELASLEGHEGAVLLASFSPDGQLIVTASLDGRAKVWNLDGIEVASLEGHDGWINSASFSPDGAPGGVRIVTASLDGRAKVWDLDGFEMASLLGHEGPVWSASFSPDGRQIVTASDDGSAKVWDLQGNEVASLEGHEGRIWSARFTPDETRGGMRIVTASSDGSAKLWDLQGNEVASLEGHEGPVRSASFSPDGVPGGNRIVTASEDGRAKVWDLQGNEVASLEGHDGWVRSASFSPDGVRIVTASDDGSAKVWDLDGNELASLEGHGGWVNSANFSPDGVRIVTTSLDGSAKVWDLDGNQVASLEGHDGWVRSASFSPDGAPGGVRIVTASADGSAKVWDLDGNEVASLEGHKDGVYAARFSPDGVRIVTASDDGSAKLWDLDGNEVASLEGHKDWVRSASFSPDGRLIVTASDDGRAKLWDLDGNEVASFLGHEGRVWSASFSPDGRLIVTASDDGSAKVWDLDGREVASLEGHDGWVRSASFSPDGRLIVTASADGRAKVWVIYSSLADQVAVARERLSGGFSDDECQRFFRDNPDSCPQTLEELFALFEDDLAQP